MINISFATEKQKKLKPAPNYQFLMVHGVSSWDVEWYKDGVVDCLEGMGIPTFNIHAYSQNFPEQSAFINAREFGDRSYTGPRRKFRSDTTTEIRLKAAVNMIRVTNLGLIWHRKILRMIMSVLIKH